MFTKGEYITRAFRFLNNRAFPQRKRLSSLMIYATDLCDSACKHCLIWAKRPATYLSLDNIKKVMGSNCISSNTSVGLEGGEFLLHPGAEEIMDWFSRNHKNYDLFSNCLQPDKLIASVKKYSPKRLYISLDGNQETYQHMRGKDGYHKVITVIEELKDTVPVFVMFTLSPYNDFNDLDHVARICEEHGVFLRVGIYNNIPFFDTIDDSRGVAFGKLKNQPVFTYSEAVTLREGKKTATQATGIQSLSDYQAQIPESIKQFQENYGYIRLYQNWVSGKLRLKCHSILDSLIVLPNGDVPICQNLDVKLGNIHHQTLDEIFNSEEAAKKQKHYSENCNQCWISYHRKYDIVLYRTLEKYFGKWATSKYLGFYKWDEDATLPYKKVIQ